MNVNSSSVIAKDPVDYRDIVPVSPAPRPVDLPEFLESPNLETVVAGIKKLSADVRRNKRNIAVALNMLVDRNLWRQVPGCASHREYLTLLADDVGISVSTLYSWMAKARVLDRRRVYLMTEGVDELVAFPVADLIDRALSVDVATLPTVADYVKNRTVREFRQYVAELEKQSKHDAGGIAVKSPTKDVEISTLTAPQQKACAIVARGATPVIVSVDRQDTEAKIEQQLAIARRQEFKLRRGMYQPVSIDPSHPSHGSPCTSACPCGFSKRRWMAS